MIRSQLPDTHCSSISWEECRWSLTLRWLVDRCGWIGSGWCFRRCRSDIFFVISMGSTSCHRWMAQIKLSLMLTFQNARLVIKRFYIFGELWELIYWRVTFFQMKLEVVGFLHILRRQTLPRLQSAGEFYFEEQELTVALPWAWRLLLCWEEGLFQYILIHITFSEIYTDNLMVFWILQRQLYADTWWHTWRLHIDMDVHVFEWCVHVLFDNVWIFGLAGASGILVVIRREAMLKWKMMFGIWSWNDFRGSDCSSWLICIQHTSTYNMCIADTRFSCVRVKIQHADFLGHLTADTFWLRSDEWV